MATTRTQELLKKCLAHSFQPVGVVGQAPKIIWERGKGSQLWDTDGKQYTDLTAGSGQCAGLGFARKELIDAAYEEMQKTPHLIISGRNMNIPAIEYAAELAEILPSDINHVYLTNSGTEAVEVAIQIIRMYWEAHGQADRYKLLILARAYHGGSALTRSLSNIGMSCFGHQYPGIVRLPDWHCYHCPFGLKYPSCNIACAKFLESVLEQEERGGDTILAFIGAPVQGQDFIWPQDEYWPIVNKLLSDHNILFFGDEVKTGFCRTGKFWAFEHWNVVPDIMTMSKGINGGYLPFGAVGISDKVYNDLKGKLFTGLLTQGANPTCVATARAALKIYAEEKLVERSAKLGEHLHERLVKEFLPLPCVDDVMGRGLMQSFEIALNKTTGSKFNPEAMKEASESASSQLLEKGVFAHVGKRVAFAPAFTITEGELDAALDVILSVVKEIKPV